MGFLSWFRLTWWLPGCFLAVSQHLKEGSGSQRLECSEICEKTGRLGDISDITPGSRFLVACFFIQRKKLVFNARELSPLHCRPRDDEAAEKGGMGLGEGLTD